MTTQPAPSVDNAGSVAALVTKFVLGVAVLLALVAVVGTYFREELEGMGTAFLAHFGYAGISMGTFLADGLHVPVPPQFYMLAAVASGRDAAGTLLAVSAGSLAGGTLAFSIARHAQRLRFFEKLLARTRPTIDRLFTRFGYGAVAVGSLTPIPYSFLCYAAGAYRMPTRIFVALSLLRLPKLALYYYLVSIGWTATG